QSSMGFLAKAYSERFVEDGVAINGVCQRMVKVSIPQPFLVHGQEIDASIRHWIGDRNLDLGQRPQSLDLVSRWMDDHVNLVVLEVQDRICALHELDFANERHSFGLTV